MNAAHIDPPAKTGRRPRILVVTSTFPRWQDDTEPRFVLDLCRELAASAEILVLAPHTPGAALEETIEGIRTRRFRYGPSRWQSIAYQGGILARLRERRLRSLQLPLFFAGLYLAVRRAIRDWSPDLIHAHWIVPQGVTACLAAGDEVPILCTSHGGDLHALRGVAFRSIKSWTLRHCAGISVVSDSMVGEARALAGDRRVDVIPMGTDLDRLFVPPPAGQARDSQGIVFVGRLVEKKGLNVLLEALASLGGLDLRLTVVGDGPLRESLQRQATALGIAGRVDFVGSVPHTELPGYYQRAALAVFPFRVAGDGDQEGFGLVVVEAMGCGCPVISCDVPAVRQSIEQGVTGLLTPPGDALALARTIRDTLADEPLRNRLADAALARTHERFGWPAVAVRFQQTIDRLLGV